MAAGKHTRGKHSASKENGNGKRKNKKEFSFPKGPGDADAQGAVRVPAEIAKTAAGRMQTAGAARDDRPQGEAAAAEVLDEWVKDQAASSSPGEMKRLERRGKALIAAVIILAAVIVGAIFLVANYRPTTTPSQVSALALESLKDGDYDAFGKLYAGDSGAVESSLENAFADGAGLGSEADLERDLNDEQKKTLSRLQEELRDFDYTIDSESVEGDAASVQVTISAHDFGTFAQDALGSYIADGIAAVSKGELESDADAATRLVSVLDAHMAELGEKGRSAQTSFSLERDDGGSWKLAELSQDNLDALTGGLLSTTSGISGQVAASDGQ